MTVIGICEEQKFNADKLKEIVENYCFQTNRKVTVLMFQDIEQVIRKIKYIDILFYDIDMLQMDSMERMLSFFKTNRDCKIIVTSEQEKYFKEAFKMNAFRWISKPYVMEEVEEALEKWFESILGLAKIQFYYDRVLYEIPQKDISYIISYESYVEAKVGSRLVRKDISLSKIEKIIEPKIFFRLNKRYIVNLMKINDYKNGTIDVCDKKILVSRRRKKQFESVFWRFRKEQE